MDMSRREVVIGKMFLAHCRSPALGSRIRSNQNLGLPNSCLVLALLQPARHVYRHIGPDPSRNPLNLDQMALSCFKHVGGGRIQRHRRRRRRFRKPLLSAAAATSTWLDPMVSSTSDSRVHELGPPLQSHIK
jgi:hypothetical protein